MTLPKRCSRKKALEFVQSQQRWIAKQVEKRPAVIPIEPGIELMILGEPWQCVHKGGRGILREAGQLKIGGEEAFFSRRLKEEICKEARIVFSRMARGKAEELGERVTAIALRDTKGRWGSCSHSGRINLSWRLALAPLEVADYVIAHEVAHLKHFDHSPAFWQVVTQLCPDWKKQKEWLKRHGQELHAYGF